MADNKFDLGDYVDVAERIKQFYDKYPDGSLQSWEKPYLEERGGQLYLVYAAAAYRNPDDPRPGVGWAWEVVPGTTPYTRTSELMNAETSAWGRAIASLGIATSRGIASKQEVQRAQSNSSGSSNGEAASKAQVGYIDRLVGDLDAKGIALGGKRPFDYLHEAKPPADMTKGEASATIERLQEILKGGAAGEIFELDLSYLSIPEESPV